MCKCASLLDKGLSKKEIAVGTCKKHGEYFKDAFDSPCPSCEDETELDNEPSWIVNHSINCYFCGKLFDEREGYPADEFNNNDGGTICPECLKEKKNDKQVASNMDS